MNTETLIISGKEVAQFLSHADCIKAVEQAFLLHAKHETPDPGILGIHVANGGFHIKAGVLNLNQSYFVAKINANFPGNKQLHGLPTIQGVVCVFHADNGRLLALIDSIEITIMRTGAATALAARELAKKNSRQLGIIGCGNQGRISAIMLDSLFELQRIVLFDINTKAAQNLAHELSHLTDAMITVAHSAEEACLGSDIIITCTTAKKGFIKPEWISTGTFIAAVGADNDDKQELDPKLLTRAKIVTDITDQCASIGELHHAIEGGYLKKEQVWAQLGQIIAGVKAGRLSDEEIIIFDSTGMALQDVAAAAIVYESALEKPVIKANLLG